MKTLKFKSHLVGKILSGTKTSTWRLFDDKDIQTGDIIDVFNKDNGDQFGVITVTDVRIKKLSAVTNEELTEQDFLSQDAMYTTMSSHYARDIAPDTEVKILTFTFASI